MERLKGSWGRNLFAVGDRCACRRGAQMMHVLVGVWKYVRVYVGFRFQ